MTFRSEDMLVGLMTFATVPWIIWIMVRAQRERRLPLGRSYVLRDERPGPYRVLLAFYAAAAGLMLFISLDLMLGIGARS
jgi:hypothetical protein